jgi:hypothetical protein
MSEEYGSLELMGLSSILGYRYIIGVFIFGNVSRATVRIDEVLYN